jgi:hypothetical protein
MPEPIPAWLERFTGAGDEPAALVPILLLDAFNLERGDGALVAFAVVGCVSGELRLVPESHVHRLPPLLLEAWERVASRKLRVVRAAEFAVCTMDAFHISRAGWRAWLRVFVHVRVTRSAIELHPLELHGEHLTPAPSALVSVKHSSGCAFHNPRSEGEITHHWWLPLASAPEVGRGHGLLLVYTMPDPAIFEGADNRVIQRRLESDLGGWVSPDDASRALETFLRFEQKRSLEPPAAPAPPVQAIPLPVRAVTPSQPNLGTLAPAPAYTAPNPPSALRVASGRDWSSDFAPPRTVKRPTRSDWWRDFAPTAVAVEDLYAPRQAQDFASDFEVASTKGKR